MKMALNFAEDETQLLIDLYRSQESLYNKDHYEYSARSVRKVLIMDIAEKLHKTPNAIMAKIEVLRTQFALALKKEKVHREQGTVQPKEWRFFRALLFLEPHMTKQTQQGRRGSSQVQDYLENGEGEMYSDQDYEAEFHHEVQDDIPVETHDATLDELEIKEEPLVSRMPGRHARKRRREQDSFDDDQFSWATPPNHPVNPPSMSPALSLQNPPTNTPPPPPPPPTTAATVMTPATPMPEDDCDAFGRLVAAELRAMGPALKLTTKRQIMSIVYSYGMGDFQT